MGGCTFAYGGLGMLRLVTVMVMRNENDLGHPICSYPFGALGRIIHLDLNLAFLGGQ
jgi:hypothetical protein